MELAKTAGAKRAISLPVSAPFHCPLMVPAQKLLEADLNATTFADLKIPLVNNWQARLIHTASEARQGLYEQVPNPVRWTESIRLLIAEGAVHWIEVGPGGVLGGLLRNIDGNQKALKFGEADDVKNLSFVS